VSIPAGPGYGRGTLAEVLPAIASHLGAEDADDALGIPEARAYVLLLVDGMGWNQLRAHGSSLSHLPELLADSFPVSAPVPTTTACSLATLGTGCAPGVHGIVGYTFRPSSGAGLLCPLDWGPMDPPPERLQPHPTWLERMEQDGVTVTTVSQAAFRGSGLTRAALRGGFFRGFGKRAPIAARAEAVRAAVAAGPSFAYVYEGGLDHAGHGKGVASRPWRDQLARIDADIAVLRRTLPGDVCLLITGDHGMVDVPARGQVPLEDTPGLSDQVDLVGGEPRLRHLYTREPGAVAARWTEVMGERAWVCTREEAVAAGWFGPQVTASTTARLGDVLVAARRDWAVMTRTREHEFRLVGHHGSLEPAEIEVPLLVDAGRG